MVLRGFTTIWSLATLPTKRSPFSLTATTLGRMSEPLSLGTTRATLLRTYATQVLVVPRSMPSRMGFSCAMRAGRCYGADPLKRKKASLRPADGVADREAVLGLGHAHRQAHGALAAHHVEAVLERAPQGVERA